jgi:stage V sporulation protein D (sporulation-specific penicillin-binding protein)
MSELPTKGMIKRIKVILLALVFGGGGLLTYNLFNISVVSAEFYRARANNQQLVGYTLNANRGSIYDRAGKVLAESHTVWDVVLSPNDIRNNKETYQEVREAMARADNAESENALPVNENIVYDEAEEISRALAEILGVDYQTVRDHCDKTDSQYVIISRKVEKDVADQINAFKDEKGIGYYSVNLYENSQRAYPNNELAAAVIGHVNYDGEGVYGVEASYDEYLTGTNGKFVQAKDANGKSMPYEYEERFAPIDGSSVYLTIDEYLQHLLEKSLAETLSDHRVANRATGIMMNPQTGEIYAMASSPGFDPNHPGELNSESEAKLASYRQALIDSSGTITTDKLSSIEDLVYERQLTLAEEQKKNKAITELYFPGSVFKTITCASSLEEHVVNLHSTFFCAGGVDVAGTHINCWSSAGHGTLNLTEAITKSCNPAFIAIGQALGAHNFSHYFEAFGFTEKTGIDLPGESGSLFVTEDNMGPVELASSSFGQTNKITPLQMITAFSAAINGGNLVTPYVVDKVVDAEGNIVLQNEPTIKRQVISEETSALMREILENVVGTNGKSNGAIAGYRMGGKSGTTQKLDEYNAATGADKIMRYVSTFCAFAPADDPQVIMLVCVDDPRGPQYYGSVVAAPVVSAVFKDGLPHLEIYPQYTAEQLAQLETMVPYIIGQTKLEAQTTLNAAGLNAEFVGEESGHKVVKTVPGPGATISKDGTVVVYLSDQAETTGIMPDVMNMTTEQATEVIGNAGFNILTDGGAVGNDQAHANMQSIAAGSEVPLGTVVQVTFMINEDAG